MGKIFKTATAFRKSLESRLMNVSQETNIDLQRLRRKVAFDRLLARFFVNDSNTWVLKGGYALEIRFSHARSTKDIDLTVPIQLYASPEYLMTMLQDASHTELGDYFTFIHKQIEELVLTCPCACPCPCPIFFIYAAILAIFVSMETILINNSRPF